MTEQRFQALKNTLTQEEFDSAEFLTNKAEELKTLDPQLSARILVRVNNLKANEAKQLALHQKNKVNNESATDQDKSPILKNKQIATKRLNRLEPQQQLMSWLKKPFIIFVVIPSLLFSFYQLFWATERFESRAKVIVQQPDASATLDAGMALLSGFGVQPSGSDTELVKAILTQTICCNI